MVSDVKKGRNSITRNAQLEAIYYKDNYSDSFLRKGFFSQLKNKFHSVRGWNMSPSIYLHHYFSCFIVLKQCFTALQPFFFLFIFYFFVSKYSEVKIFCLPFSLPQCFFCFKNRGRGIVKECTILFINFFILVYIGKGNNCEKTRFVFFLLLMPPFQTIIDLGSFAITSLLIVCIKTEISSKKGNETYVRRTILKKKKWKLLSIKL